MLIVSLCLGSGRERLTSFSHHFRKKASKYLLESYIRFSQIPWSLPYLLSKSVHWFLSWWEQWLVIGQTIRSLSYDKHVRFKMHSFHLLVCEKMFWRPGSLSQQESICSKSTIKTLEKGVKMFKVNNKDTKTTSTSFCCLYG